MFNNIIYFIIVLLVFTTGQSERDQAESLLYSISMIFLSWFILVFYCRTGFKRIVKIYEKGAGSGYPAMYNRLVFRLSLVSIIIFSLDVYAFNLKYLLERIPVAGSINIFQDILAIILFTLYLSTIWYFAHPAYNIIYNTDIRKKAFILWNIRLNLPVVFPWLLMSIGFDVVSLSPWPGFNSFFERPEGQILFFGLFLVIAIIFLPVLVQFFWGCRPIRTSQKTESIRDFLKCLDLKYRALVNWPLLGGKMMTAGIMGIIPRFRYILVTESLMDVLTPSELNAVMAHEAGHAKYNHLVLLSLFFLGFFILVVGFVDGGFYETVMTYMIYQITGGIESEDIYNLILTVPILAAMIIYFRFIMGFFMRNFERQADTYAAITIGDPSPIISSLEKIALLSGRIRDLPSWHHFSIKQRIDFLVKSQDDPGVIRRHRKFLLSSLLIYVGLILSLSYILYMTPIKGQITDKLVNRAINQEVEKNPDNIDDLMDLAAINIKMGRPDRAVKVYEKILLLKRNDPTVINNLAWLLLTTDDSNIKDIKRGFALAKEAVELERSPEILDTLAEAYWAMGNKETAVQLEKEAVMNDKKDNPHYRKQLEKFYSQ